MKKILLIVFMVLGFTFNAVGKEVDYELLHFIDMKIGDEMTVSSGNLFRTLSYKVVRIYGGWVIRDSILDDNCFIFIPYDDFMKEYANEKKH